MAINALGAQYLDSGYVPFSFSDISGSQAPVSGILPESSGAFDEIIKKAQAASSASGAGGSAPTVSGKTEIDKTDKLYEMCMELETFLIKNLIKSMRSTVQKSELIDTGFAGEMYEDMLYDEYAKSFAKNSGFGFAEMAYRELSSAVQN